MSLTFQEIIHIILFAGMLLAMPGPTNTLLLFAGATSGFLKAQKLILVEAVGYFIAISVWGYMMSVLSAQLPSMVIIIKILSAIYIFWLSLKIWRFQQQELNQAIITAKNVLITTIFNPKAFVFASYILPEKTFTDLTTFPIVMLVFLLTLLPVSFIWCVSGHFLYLKKKESASTKSPIFCGIASAALCAFSISILYNALH